MSGLHTAGPVTGTQLAGAHIIDLELDEVSAVPQVLRWETLMESTEYKSDYFDRVEAHAKADALLKFLKSRGIDLTDEQHDEVTSCTDPNLVDLWMDRAYGGATSADDIFKK